MKNLIFTLTLVLFSITMYGQWDWEIDFESKQNLDRISIDSSSNKNCSWQVGKPQKTTFTSAFSIPNVLVTDTLLPVPKNDTSIFYLKHVRREQPFHAFDLNFKFQMDGDSTDFGIIEISPDSGKTWINVLTNDSVYQMFWNTTKPTLAGSSEGWQSFELDLTQWASDFGTYPVKMTADTILFRFTYITDSNSTAHDGWMIDDINIRDIFEGIRPINLNNLISIYPNPVSDKLNIVSIELFTKPSIQIINTTGQIFYEMAHFDGDQIDSEHIPNGVYLLKCIDMNQFTVKKFIVQH